jgi:hypothetical protein
MNSQVILSPEELNNLLILWRFHRTDCDHQGDITITLLPGGGIGTVVMVRCGCNKELDVTDYSSW